MLCYCYGSVSDQIGPSAFNKFDLIWLNYTGRFHALSSAAGLAQKNHATLRIW